MNDYVFLSTGPEMTCAFGRRLGEILRAGDVVALIGEIGSGKTCLTQGIARGLAVPESFGITSPTFTVINEYPGRVVFYHMDMYRLATVKDLEDTGYGGCFHDKAVVVIEWAEKIREALPRELIVVSLTYLGEKERQIALSGDGARLEEIMNELKRGGL